MLNELAREINKIAMEKGFWEEGKDRNPAAILMLIVSEAAEALEEIRDGNSLNEKAFTKDKFGILKPTGVASEMADIIIRVLDACYMWEIDIDYAVIEKIKYNKTRPHKHGRLM